MPIMEYTHCLIVLFMISVVNCDLCVEKNVYTWFTSDSSRCKVLFNGTLSVASQRFDVSNVEISNNTPNCILSSQSLSLASGGILKVNVYSKLVTEEDYLTVLVYEEEENNVVGRATLLEDTKVSDGRIVLEVILGGKQEYDGYIILVGKASSSSEILVESICYSPAQQQKLLSEDAELTHTNAQHIHALQTDSNLKSESTNERPFRIFDVEDFWTPLTITLAVIIPVTVLVLLGWACFALGKRRGAKQVPPIAYEDINNLPKPYLVPRVRNVYAESDTSVYGGRNNNIYSV